jgi:hypothetical protein
MTAHTHTPVGYVPQAIDLPNLPHGSPLELIDAIKAGARDVLNQHGPTAFEMSREAALAHEAGHAIVGAHEGLIIRRVTISSRHVPNFGTLWGGWCTEGGGRWTTGPDSTADEDFSRARFIIAGLVGEVVTSTHKPGSSIEEVALSQLIGANAGAKLTDHNMSHEEYVAYQERLWNERVWRVAGIILIDNRAPFLKIVEHLHQHEIIKGGKLRKILANVKRIAS